LVKKESLDASGLACVVVAFPLAKERLKIRVLPLLRSFS
jgi:hypothetical protein